MSKKEVKVIDTVVVTLQDFHLPEFQYPSRFCIRDAMGNYVFIKVNKRETALQYIQDNYDSKYSLREV